MGVHQAHHLPYKNHRRGQDNVVPLCAECHRWVQQTAEGLRWEREHHDELMLRAYDVKTAALAERV